MVPLANQTPSFEVHTTCRPPFESTAMSVPFTFSGVSVLSVGTVCGPNETGTPVGGSVDSATAPRVQIPLSFRLATFTAGRKGDPTGLGSAISSFSSS